MRRIRFNLIFMKNISDQLKVFLYKLHNYRIFSLEFVCKVLGINPSYSQFGEDLIIEHLLGLMNVPKPVYLDVGANDPRRGSNTFLFYKKGGSGVLVEPNPDLCKKLMRHRKRDVVLNAGIGVGQEKEGTFFLFEGQLNGLSSFSEKSVSYWENVGLRGIGKVKAAKAVKIPLITMDKVFEHHFKERMPDFVSIDIEGLDLEILQSMDLNKYRPNVICCEASYYDERQHVHKDMKIIDHMLSNGYFVYADTFINTIFVNKKWFDGRTS